MKYIYFALSLILIIIGYGLWLTRSLPRETKPQFSVAYSIEYARYLGLDPLVAYKSILKELRPKQVRLQIDWDKVEIQEGQYDFSDVDTLVKLAAEQGTQVVLAIGRKVPRWPECHDPAWLKTKEPWLIPDYIDKLLRVEVAFFKANPNIVMWQLENEPLFPFGNCPPPNLHQLMTELKLLRSLDQRPVLLTDTGELTNWWETARVADVQGVTMYRTTWNSLFGYQQYPMSPFFYRLKAALAQAWGPRVIVSELQMEPWAPADIRSLSRAEIDKSFSLDKFTQNINFFKSTGLPEAYVWGVEWWYYMKQKGEPEYWLLGQRLFNE